MPGPTLRPLFSPRKLSVRECLTHEFAAVSVNNANLFSAKVFCRIDDMREHRTARQWLKHFGPVGTHSGSLPGSKNDDTDVSGHDCAT
jgi:hypothetical protein